MRNILFLIAYIMGVPLSLRHPIWAVLFYYWISLMNPHQYAWGISDLIPYAKIAAALCILSIIIHFRKIHFPNRLEFWGMILFWLLIFLSSHFAEYKEYAMSTFLEISKVFIMALATTLVLTDRDKLVKFISAILIFVGFIGLKGAIFTVATGGAYRVYGPDHSSLADNNDVGLAMVMIIPLCFSMANIMKEKWKIMAFRIIGFSSIISGIFTYSRGAFLGMMVVGASYVIISKRKLLYILLLPIIAISLFWIAPQKYKDRIFSIKKYEYDRSSMQRLNSWAFSYNLAKDRIIGGGFGCFTPELYYIYAPDPTLGIQINKEGKLEAFTAHSIYFQTLAEHGFIGLFIFLGNIASLLFSLVRIKYLTNNYRSLEWYNLLTQGFIISVIGYLASGAFLSRAYFEVFWALYAAGVCLIHLFYNEISAKKRRNSPFNYRISKPQNVQMNV